MSSLRRFNGRESLGATAAATGADTGGLVQTSGAQQKSAAKTQFISPTRSVMGSPIPLLFRPRGCHGREACESEPMGRDYVSAPLASLYLEKSAEASCRGGDANVRCCPAVEPSLTSASVASDMIRLSAQAFSAGGIV